jgi:SSS family solute:Na+ symporter
MTDDQVAKLARVMVVALGVVSLCLAIYTSTTLVSLLLIGYAGVTQFFPGVVLGLYWKRVTASAVFAGMIAGVAASIFLMLSHRDPLFGWSAGFVALCLNFLITIFLSLLTPAVCEASQPRVRGSNSAPRSNSGRIVNRRPATGSICELEDIQ